MCGICGFISSEKVSTISHEKIDVMINKLSHRGPDYNEKWYNEKIIFGHTRLSIIDLTEKSNQPFVSSCGNFVIVFNGEIYNHAELRYKLEQEGIKFLTNHSDTEVVVNAYKKWGVGFLEKLIGMFAFSIYDIRSSKVFFVRDRIGQKPLYYTKDQQGLYFSSEITPLFDAGVLEKKIDKEAVYDYLTLLTTPAPRTFFQNVYKLQAGFYLEYDLRNNDLKKFSYWDVSDYINIQSSDDYNTAKNKTKNLIKSAIKYRNVSDVPIAYALSGGLDSSLNLFFSENRNKKEGLAINISYKNSLESNESIPASMLAKKLGFRFEKIEITSEIFLSWLDEYLSIQKDVPNGDPNSILMYGLSKIAHERGFKVIIVGEGGDEIGGYPIYRKIWTFSKLSVFKKLARLTLKLGLFKNRLSLRKLLETDFLHKRFIFGFTEEEKQKFWKYNTDLNTTKKLDFLGSDINVKSKDMLLRQISNIEYKLRLPELILPRIDYPTMSNSLEARSPFIDHRLIEYSSSLSWKIKLKKGAKSLIKETATFHLPDYIVKGKKVGFGQLLQPFLVDILPKWFEDQILKNDAPILNYIERDYLINLIKTHSIQKNQGYRIWILYSLNKWLEVNFES